MDIFDWIRNKLMTSKFEPVETSDETQSFQLKSVLSPIKGISLCVILGIFSFMNLAFLIVNAVGFSHCPYATIMNLIAISFIFLITVPFVILGFFKTNKITLLLNIVCFCLLVLFIFAWGGVDIYILTITSSCAEVL
jgi:hypothetical protein